VPDEEVARLEIFEEAGRDEVVPAVAEALVDLAVDQAFAGVDEPGRVAERARVALCASSPGGRR
jgi:hypothetical protein